MEVASPISTVKTMIVAILVSAILFRGASAANLTIGGSSGWDLSTDLTQWSATASFFVNDSLVFIYTPAHDVIEVSKQNFMACQVNSPIAVYNDGETVIPLTQSGTRYFVCGRPNHCAMGLKVRVQVLDEEHSHSHRHPHRPPGTKEPPSHHDLPEFNLPPPSGPSTNGCGKIDFLALSSFLMHVVLIAFQVF